MKILYVFRHSNMSGYYILKQLIDDGFEIIVANNVPDNHNVEFEV